MTTSRGEQEGSLPAAGDRVLDGRRLTLLVPVAARLRLAHL